MSCDTCALAGLGWAGRWDRECCFFKRVLFVVKKPGAPKSKVNPADADIACTRMSVRNSTIVDSDPSKCKHGLCSDQARSAQVIVMSPGTS